MTSSENSFYNLLCYFWKSPEENTHKINETDEIIIEAKKFEPKEKILFYICQPTSGSRILESDQNKIEDGESGIKLINPKNMYLNENLRNIFFIVIRVNYKTSLKATVKTKNINQPTISNFIQNFKKDCDLLEVYQEGSVMYTLFNQNNIEILSGKDFSGFTNIDIKNYLTQWKLNLKSFNIHFRFLFCGGKGEKKNLFHATNMKAAYSIYASGEMRPGKKGMYGPGIYFADSEDLAQHKTNYGSACLIFASVTLNKSLFIKSLPYNIKELRTFEYSVVKKLDAESVIGITNTGLEYIVYNTENVKVLKIKTTELEITLGENFDLLRGKNEKEGISGIEDVKLFLNEHQESLEKEEKQIINKLLEKNEKRLPKGQKRIKGILKN